MTQQQQQPVEETIQAEDGTPFVINRTRLMTKTEDPLAVPEDPEAESAQNESAVETSSEQVEQVTQPETEQEGKEEENSGHDEFFTSLDRVLQDKTGVNFDDFIGVLTDLVQWRNDILMLEQQQQSQPQQPRRTNPPQFQRSQGRTAATPAEQDYQFTQSQIERMSPQEYQQRAQEITNAYLQGRVLMK